MNLPRGITVNVQPSDRNNTIQLWAEVWNLIDVAYLILTSALFRKESRGGHYRLDFPQTETEWQDHTVIEQDVWQQQSISGLS